MDRHEFHIICTFYTKNTKTQKIVKTDVYTMLEDFAILTPLCHTGFVKLLTVSVTNIFYLFTFLNYSD